MTLFPETEEMRYLGWKQPYASLMLLGKIETRTWATKYRGLVLITASKTFYSEAQIMRISGERQTQHAFTALLKAGIKEPLGMAIAVGRLVDCRPMRKEDEDKCFVQYHPDLFCHVYEDVRPIEPIPIKGAQGWRKLSPEFISQIKYLTK